MMRKQGTQFIDAVARVCLILVFGVEAGGTQQAQEPAARKEPANSAVQADAAQNSPPLKNQIEVLSYALGMMLGAQFRTESLAVDPDVYLQGLRDALSGGKTVLTEKEARAAVAELQNRLRTKQLAIERDTIVRNKQKGEAFLAENKGKEGVVTRPSGLQYKILKAGDGQTPSRNDTVVCHYRGMSLDGAEFDSSYRRNAPAAFPVKDVIKGWAEALQLMPVGSRWQLFVPPHLAYGAHGAGRSIGPNATLIFEMELISIKNASAVDPPSPAVSSISVSFQLDSHLTQGLYMGDRWVSPPNFSAASQGKACTVNARARGLGPAGQALRMSPQWKPSDPEMVTVTPDEGAEVKITVRRAGQSHLLVAFGAVTKELTIQASYQNDVTQVEIAQKDVIQISQKH